MKITADRLEQDKLIAGSRSFKGWQLDGMALLFFVALTIAMTWPLTPNMGYVLESWGDALLQTWTLDWDAHALLSNPLHFADANAFYPYANSLAFSETLAGQALLVAPVIWLTDNPVLAYNLLLLGSFILCGWGMYLLGKELTGSRPAGLIAGIIFAFFPHRFGQFSHLHLLTAQWMPLCLLFLRRGLGIENRKSGDGGQGSGVRGRKAEDDPAFPPTTDSRPLALRNLFLFGLFFVLQLLCSTYLGLFLAVTVGLYLIYHSIRGLAVRGQGKFTIFDFRFSIKQHRPKPQSSVLSPQSSVLNKSLWLSIILIAVVLIVLPFYWPYLAVQQDLGFERSVAEVQSFSAQPFYYLDVPQTNILNKALYRPIFQQGWWQGSAGGERGLYLGLTAMILGLIGGILAFRRQRDPDNLFYLLLGGLAVSFTFGPVWQSGRFGAIPLPYALLYNYVPGFGAIRVPVRFIYVVALAVAALAAYTVAWLTQSRWRLQKGWQVGLLTCGLIAILSGEYWTEIGFQESDALRREAPAVEQWLNEHPAPALHLPLSGSDSSNLFIQYWTRGSWRPILNGFSGFMPPAYDALKQSVAREGFSPRIIALLQGLEVRYIVIDTEEDSVRPQWSKLKAGLEQANATEAARFGSTIVYELKADGWLSRLKEAGLGPDSAVYFVEYRRNQGQLLELTASFLQRQGLIGRENLFGTISIGARPLPPLPEGKPADFLALASGEDPTLYGFRPDDKIYSNPLLAFYKKSPDLVARYDFSRQDNIGALNRSKPLSIGPDSNKLRFDGPSGQAGSEPRYLTLGLAVLQPQKLNIEIVNAQTQTLELAPGLSVYRLPLGAGLTLKGGTFSLVWAELWRGSPVKAGPELRPDVVLLSASANFDEKDGAGLAQMQVVIPGEVKGYSATLDIYNSPWGSHPNGHYGYWSLPLDAGNNNTLEWRLNLTRKLMTTRLNAQDVPNFPPDPKDLDLTKYGNYGDFRATLNLFAGSKLVGSARLYDFTTWAQGDKNRLENRRAGGFKGYPTSLAFLVLPPR